jgi:hypothetical protein
MGNLVVKTLVQVTYTQEEAQLVIDGLEAINPENAGSELLAREMALELREAMWAHDLKRGDQATAVREFMDALAKRGDSGDFYATMERLVQATSVEYLRSVLEVIERAQEQKGG